MDNVSFKLSDDNKAIIATYKDHDGVVINRKIPLNNKLSTENSPPKETCDCNNDLGDIPWNPIVVDAHHDNVYDLCGHILEIVNGTVKLGCELNLIMDECITWKLKEGCNPKYIVGLSEELLCLKHKGTDPCGHCKPSKVMVPRKIYQMDPGLTYIQAGASILDNSVPLIGDNSTLDPTQFTLDIVNDTITYIGECDKYFEIIYTITFRNDPPISNTSAEIYVDLNGNPIPQSYIVDVVQEAIASTLQSSVSTFYVLLSKDDVLTFRASNLIIGNTQTKEGTSINPNRIQISQV